MLAEKVNEKEEQSGAVRQKCSHFLSMGRCKFGNEVSGISQR